MYCHYCVHVYVCTCTCMCTCIVCTCLCICVHVLSLLCVCVCVYMYMYNVCVHVCVCVYVYMYCVYMYVYVCTCILCMCIVCTSCPVILFSFRHHAMNSSGIVLYAFTSFIAGIISSNFYHKINGENWVWNIMLTACLFAGKNDFLCICTVTSSILSIPLFIYLSIYSSVNLCIN